MASLIEKLVALEWQEIKKQKEIEKQQQLKLSSGRLTAEQLDKVRRTDLTFIK